MRDVYATMFRLGSVERPHGPLLEAAAAAALDWVFEKYPGAPPPGDIGAGSLSVARDHAEWATETADDDERRLWSLLWRQHSQDDPGLIWRTLIHVAHDGRETRFTLRLAIESESLRIVPARYDVGRQNVVRLLAERVGARVDDRDLTAWPLRARSDQIRGSYVTDYCSRGRCSATRDQCSCK